MGIWVHARAAMGSQETWNWNSRAVSTGVTKQILAISRKHVINSYNLMGRKHSYT